MSSQKTKFITNEQNQSLLQRFKEIIPKNTERFDILVGYLFGSGFKQLIEDLDNLSDIRVLVGIKIDEDLYHLVNCENQLIATDQEKKDSFNKLIEFIRKGKLKIKAYPEKIHAKMYIFHFNNEIKKIIEGIVITGSSNFSQSGLNDNLEINVELKDPEDYLWAKNKFDELWNKAVDITEKYVNSIEKQSKFTPKSPYQIFIKSLYEYQKDQINEAFNNKLEIKDLIYGSKVELSEFQSDAVKRVENNLKKFGVSMIADSVGLGKTWIAKKFAEKIGYHQRKQVLVICPAQIEETWKKELKKINVIPNILTQEKLANLNDVKKECESLLKINFNDIYLLIVDESHNFRNPLSNRFENLSLLIDFIKKENQKLKIIFMTATPINNTVWDLYYQLYLMLRSDKALIKEGIDDLKKHFKKAEKENQKLSDVMHLLSIRRNRNFIIEKYPNSMINGQPVKFPKRVLKNINYQLNEVYKGIYQKITFLIETSPLAYYRFIEFKKDLTDADKKNLQRMIALTGIFRTILLKRLESSVEAFRRSVDDHLKFIELIKKLVDQGKIITKKIFQELLAYYEQEELFDELKIEKFIQHPETISFDKEDYRLDEFKKDLSKDIENYQLMYDLVKNIDYEKDAKIRTLEDYLKIIDKSNQIIIFSYYSDTLNYIFQYFKNNTDFKEFSLAKIDGATDPKIRQKIVSDFTAKKIDILFSTDVLSEGQNLQTAQNLINYDLHWNPTRMIQRAGRIDRIGSPYDEIYVYNFFPDDELESLLKLVKILQDKIKKIDDQVGLDQSVLGEKIHPKVFGTLVRIKNQDQKVLEEQEDEIIGGRDIFWEAILDYYNKYGNFDEVEKLPYEIYSGKKGYLSGIYFYYQYGEDYHLWYFYDIKNKKILTKKDDILELINCEEKERIFMPNWEKEFFRVKKLIESEIERWFSEREVISQSGRLNEYSAREEKFVQDALNLFNAQILENEIEDKLVDVFEEIKNILFKTTKTKKMLQQLRRVWQRFPNMDEKINNWRIIFEEWYEILKTRPIIEEEKNFEKFNKNQLKLVAYEFIS